MASPSALPTESQFYENSCQSPLSFLNNDPIPNFDWTTIPPAGPEMEIDVPKRLEELRMYLHENTYPPHQKNIEAAIKMYEQNQLPRQDGRRVHFQDGKVINLTVAALLRNGHVWTEVCFIIIN